MFLFDLSVVCILITVQAMRSEGQKTNFLLSKFLVFIISF